MLARKCMGGLSTAMWSAKWSPLIAGAGTGMTVAECILFS
jgi:hypothetical protein